MLVIPALLSLKQNVLEKATPEIIELISCVTKKLKDPEEIVAKTAKKLILELQKCYPHNFEALVVSNMRSDNEKSLCKSIINHDEEETQRLLYSQTIGGPTNF